MQLDPTDFNAFLGQIGQSFSWRKAYMCPCVNPATNSAKLDCPHCHGKAWLWAPPVIGIAGVPSQRVQRQFAAATQWETGDMMLTVPSDSPLYDMGERDRVLQINGDDPFSMNLRHGINDRLPWPVKSISRVFWIAGSSIVEGGIPTQQEDGDLVFSDGAPPAGATYSVSGKKFSEYFVYRDFPSDRGHHFGAALPIKVQLRRFDLFGR